MLLPNEHPKSRLMKGFNSLGPYLRERQSKDNRFFFDCLAVCVNSKPSPEKREFWGWWVEVDAVPEGFIYRSYFGLFDKQGLWQEKTIKDEEIKCELDKTFKHFHQVLNNYIQSLNLSLANGATN